MLLARVDGMVRADSVTLDGKGDAELSQVETVSGGGGYGRCGRCHVAGTVAQDRSPVQRKKTEQDYVL